MNDQVFSTIVGHVDTTAHDVMSGWAFDPAHPDRRVELELLHEGETLCTFAADRYRDDLLEAGMGDGCHGFQLRLPIDIFTTPLVSLRVRTLAHGVDLVGSPFAVRNHRALVDSDTLVVVGDAIRSAVQVARHSDDLVVLSSWLIQHFDMVYQRQTKLSADSMVRTRQFNEVIAQNTGLSDLLKQAAGAVVASYPPLSLPDVEHPDVSVIVPAFGNFAYTYRCLSSLVEHLPKVTMEVVLVDDCSTDETVYAALVLSTGFKIVRNSKNVGFLKSVMNGAGSARGKYLLFLNNDTEVTAGWLDTLVRTFDLDSTIGIAGSKLLYPDGRLQEVGGIIWRQAMGWNWGHGQDANDPRFCFLQDSDYVSGAALMISRDVFDEVQGFSAEFAPGYYEDTDLCFKVRASGRRVVVQPGSQIIHYEGVTAGTEVSTGGMKRFQRVNQRLFLQKWFDTLQSHHLGDDDPQAAMDRLVRQRVLFIDDSVPTPDRDAGSNAALEHMRSLQRVGYQVSFVGADNMARIPPYTPALEQIGVKNYYAPYFHSVEEIFRREITKFDLFYIHRMSNVVKYAPMIRQRFPGVRIVFNVADLHHLRLEREAIVTGNAEIGEQAGRTKEIELAAIAASDSIIVHSTYERAMLADLAPAADVHVVPWVVRSKRTPVPFDDRCGLAFVGGYNHTPNVDAARWLVEDIMPLVHERNARIRCMLVGSDMPDVIRSLERPGIEIVGHASDLAAIFGKVRLTAAPIRYGAGLKGKVLTSFAAGLPCVATSCATEGMDLPAIFEMATADSARDFAERILSIHGDSALNANLSEAGIEFIEGHCSEAAIDKLMGALVRSEKTRHSGGDPAALA